MNKLELEIQRLQARLNAIPALQENRDMCPVCGCELTRFEQRTGYAGSKPIYGDLLVCLRCEREYGTWSDY